MTARIKTAMFGKETGFTLVELLVAMTILTTVVLVFAGIINYSSIISKRNQEENVAIGLCQQKIEETKGFWPKKTTIFSDPTKIPSETDNPITVNGKTYYRTITATSVDSSSLSWQDPNGMAINAKYYIRVTVTVSWKSNTKDGQVNRSVGMITYVTGR
ncbi:MAG TPA: type II secretion system protein [Verrucomicrobiae bacterium]|nr:type II secretion system protein [Verrucomicrobiae bacterium]